MKRLWLSGLCVWAGWFVGAASGQEACWRPASPRPLAIARTEGAPLGAPAGVTLGLPQPLTRSGDAADGGGVVPTSFRPAAAPDTGAVVRGKFLEDAAPPAAEAAAKKPPADLPASTLPAPSLPASPGLAPGEILPKVPSPGQAPGKTADPNIPAPPRAVAPGSPTAFGTDCGDCGPPSGCVVGEGNVPLLPSTESSWSSALAPAGQFYGYAEYLLWWLKGYRTPPLASTSDPTVPQNLQGVLGPQTTVLFGGNRLEQDPFSGGRFTAGYRFGPCNIWAVEGSYFFLGQNTSRFSATSPNPMVIARPFIARLPDGTLMENAQLVASPGINSGDLFAASGTLRIDAPTQFWGAEANLRRTVCCGCNYKLDVLVGYRYLNLSEGLHITEDILNQRTVNIRPGLVVNPGDRIVVTDRFDTRNTFHGGQVGAIGEWQRGRWFFGGTVKVAMGNMHQVIDIHGGTSITPAGGGAPTNFNAGLLALGSNSGTFTRDTFAVAPEVSLKVGYQLTNNIRAYVGYNFLYISSVVRPGDQIDRVLDVNQIPPFSAGAPPAPARPLVPFHTTDFWAQGLVAGLEFRY
jgi:hypothetical protein